MEINTRVNEISKYLNDLYGTVEYKRKIKRFEEENKELKKQLNNAYVYI